MFSFIIANTDAMIGPWWGDELVVSTMGNWLRYHA